MLRFYFILLVGSGFVSLVFLNEDAAIMAVLVTLGLAYPLLFSPSIFLYFIGIFPLVVWQGTPRNRKYVQIITGFILAAMATIPGVMSKLEERNVRGQLRKVVKKMDTNTLPRTLEIRRPGIFIANLKGHVFEKEMCDSICRALIESGQVDWIRVKSSKINTGNVKSGLATNTLFQAGKSSDECKVPGSSKPTEFPCVLVKADHGRSAGLIIQITEGYNYNRRAAVLDFLEGPNFTGWRKVTARKSNTLDDDLVFYQEEQQMSSVTIPTIIHMELYGLYSAGYELTHSTVRVNPINYREMFRSIGFGVSQKAIIPTSMKLEKKPSQEIEPTDQQIRDVISVLDLPGDELFNSAQDELINKWINNASHYSIWTKDRIGIARRILHDKRIRSAPFFHGVATKPAVSKALLGEALSLLENTHEYKMHETVKNYVYMIHHVDKNILMPHREQIARILREKPYGKYFPVLIKTAAWLGQSPIPYFDKLEGKDGSYYNKLRGRGRRYVLLSSLCMVTPIGQKVIVDRLREDLRLFMADKTSRNEEQPGTLADMALRALHLQGDADYVEKFIRGIPRWKNPERVIRRTRRTSLYKPDSRWSNCR